MSDPSDTTPTTIDHQPGEATGEFATERTTPAVEPPPDTIGNYEILGEVARGGMGVVYKARQRGLDRVVALKVVLAGRHAGPGERERFRREALSIAQLDHPHIVGVIEIGEHEGQLYQALEFCPGGTLADRLAGTPLPAREAAALVEKLARAMQAAHGKGIVHRDLKPRNILFDEAGEPRVGDFGLAKLANADEGQTNTGAILGTPSYMAPEQAQGQAREAGPLADVYALGAILYECLTGRPPFKGATLLETLEQVRTCEAVSPRGLNTAVPRDLETVCLKCLQKEPGKRYASAQDLADDLARFVRGEPVRARPVGALERGLRWCRRNPVVASLSAAVLLLLIGVAVASVLVAFQLDQARRDVAAQFQRFKDGSARLDDAQGLIAQGRWADALQAHDDAIAELPDLAPMHLARGRFYFRLGLFPEALADVVEAQRLQPSLDPRVWYLHALLYRLTGDEAGADRVVAAAAEEFSQADEPEVAGWLYRLRTLRLDARNRADELRRLVETAQLKKDALADAVGLVLGTVRLNKIPTTPSSLSERLSVGPLVVLSLVQRTQPEAARNQLRELERDLSEGLYNFFVRPAGPGASARWPRDFDTRTNAALALSRDSLVVALRSRDAAAAVGLPDVYGAQMLRAERANGLALLDRKVEALDVIEEVIAATPTPEPSLWVEKGRLLAALGAHDEMTAALVEATRGLKARRHRTGDWSREASLCEETSQLLEDAGRYREASEVLDALPVTHAQSQAALPLRRGRLLLKAGDPKAAAPHYQAAVGREYPITLGPRESELEVMRDVCREDALYAHLIPTPTLHLIRAECLLEAGRSREAATALGAFLHERFQPSRSNPWGEEYLVQRDRLFALAVELAPDDPSLWAARAAWLTDRKEWEPAVAAIDRALAGAEAVGPAAAPRTIGAATEARRRVLELLGEQKDLFDRMPAGGRGAVAAALARLRKLLEAKAFPEATQVLAQTRARLGQHLGFERAATDLLFQAGRREEGLECLRNWAALAPKDPQARMRLFQALAASDRAQATEHLLAALDLVDETGTPAERAGLRAQIRIAAPYDAIVTDVINRREQEWLLLEIRAYQILSAGAPEPRRRGEAAQYLMRAAERHPRADLYARAAMLFQRLIGQPVAGYSPSERAAAAWARALQLAPDRNYSFPLPDPRASGEVRDQPVRRWLAANEELFAALAAQHPCADAGLWAERALYLSSRGRYAEAEAALEALLYAAPAQATTHLERGRYWAFQAGRKDNPASAQAVERAVAEYRTAIERLPSLPRGVEVRQSLFFWAAANDEVFAALLKAGVAEEAYLWDGRARWLARRQPPQDPQEAMKRAWQDRPDDLYLRFSRAGQAAQAGQWAVAGADLIAVAERAGFEADPTMAVAIATGLALAGRVAEYDAYRQRLLARYGATTDRSVARAVGLACAVRSAGAEQKAVLLRLAAALGDEPSPALATVRALLELRGGQALEAARRLRTLPEETTSEGLLRRLVLALALVETAPNNSDTAQARAEALRLGPGSGPTWWWRGLNQALHAELRATVLPAPRP